MNKTYLVVLSADHDRDKVLEFFNTAPNIQFWFYSMPYSVFVKTPLTSQQLSDLIENKFGVNRLFVTEVGHNYWGRMPKEHWDFFK